MKRKNYSNKLKAKVAVAAIKIDHTANVIASEFGIHVSQVNRRKNSFLLIWFCVCMIVKNTSQSNCFCCPVKKYG